jgi:hypothetical protein
MGKGPSTKGGVAVGVGVLVAGRGVGVGVAVVVGATNKCGTAGTSVAVGAGNGWVGSSAQPDRMHNNSSVKPIA